MARSRPSRDDAPSGAPAILPAAGDAAWTAEQLGEWAAAFRELAGKGGRFMTPLPRRVRARLWLTKRTDGAAIWLLDIAMVDTYAGERSINRSEAIRRLMTDAVTRERAAAGVPLSPKVNR